jgi:hypothetical protein
MLTDTERIDALERLLRSGSIGNGIAIFPCTEIKTGRRLVSLADLGGEDGSNLGEELTEAVSTLREAIDLAVSALEAKVKPMSADELLTRSDGCNMLKGRTINISFPNAPVSGGTPSAQVAGSDLPICRVCDGGPGNNGVCLCGEHAYGPNRGLSNTETKT